MPLQQFGCNWAIDFKAAGLGGRRHGSALFLEMRLVLGVRDEF